MSAATDLFGTALGFIWRPENDGQGFHDDPSDPGGATSWGVTFATWSGWARLHGLRAVTLDAFKSLGQPDFSPLYQAWFWNACCCGDLPAGVGLSVFDTGVGSAPAHAVRFLQSVLGVAQDGLIGPATLAAAVRTPPRRIIDALCVQRETFYASLPMFRIYGNGWDRRAEDCRHLALGLAAP